MDVQLPDRRFAIYVNNYGKTGQNGWVKVLGMIGAKFELDQTNTTLYTEVAVRRVQNLIKETAPEATITTCQMVPI